MIIEESDDLVLWRLEADSLRLEFMPWAEDAPAGESPVTIVDLRGIKPPGDLAADLDELVRGGFWGLAEERTAEGVAVTLEGEGCSVVIPCKAVEVARQSLERRHYDLVIARHRRQAEWATEQNRRLHEQVRRTEVFLQQQEQRAGRILAEAGPSRADARSRAEARLRLVHELVNILKGAGAV
jgi:hypothetical protein